MRPHARLQNARRRGFTLVEVLISLVLFVLVTVMGATLLVRTTGFVTEAVFRSDLMEDAKITQERVFDHLFSAKVISLGFLGGQPAVTVVVPLELPVGGGPRVDFCDAQGQINWGAVEPNGPQLDTTGSPHRLNISFRATGAINEKDCRLDLNHDGDQADRFQLGSLGVQTTAGPELRFMTNRLVAPETGQAPLDIDGDQVPDPLFQINGETYTDANQNGLHDAGEVFTDANSNGRWDGVLSVNILTVGRDRTGRGHRFVYKAGVKLLNN